MANLTRYNPVDDLLHGFFMRPVRMEETPEVQVKLDVKEDDKAYTVHAEIAGAKKEDIHVTIEGNQVSISAEVKKEKEEKQGEKVLRSERYFGKVSRSFAVGQEIDEGASQAKYNNGILELTLPKKSTSQSKKLTIT